MKSYKYTARDSSGQRREGLKEAGSSNDVLSWLRDQGFTPVSVTEVSAGAPQAKRTQHQKRIKSADLAALCWQLTTMVEGGIPVTTALDTISDDIENLQLQEVLKQVLDMMEKGETFSNSVAEFPKVFNNLSCALILAGEAGGNLPEALRRLAEYFDNRDKLAKKVKGAMAYPIFVLGFIVLIVIFIMAFIIPRFTVIFDQFGGDLPGFTKGFMAVYDMLRYNLVYIIGTVLLAVTASVLLYSKTEKGHYAFCKIALKLPLFGKVFSQAFIVMFCRTMATLLGAGVSVLEVLDILHTMTSNDIIKGAIIRTRERVVGGSNISMSLAASGFFPNMVVKMIQVGEESGSLSKVLERTSNYYERKVDAIIMTLMSLLEPIMIVTVGGIVLIVVLALYLPIFSMSA
jgi:type II secretory pathway component PulF